MAGIGDLIATCSSPLSRNRTFGENLGKGLTVGTIERTNQTCEGVKSSRAFWSLPNATVSIPITHEVVKVVHEGMRPQEMLANLMSRDTRAEQGHDDDLSRQRRQLAVVRALRPDGGNTGGCGRSSDYWP